MQVYFAFIRNRWVRTLFGVLVLSAVIWFFGPMLGIGQAHPFDSLLIRIIVIVALLVLWLLLNLLRTLQHARKERALHEDVAKPAADATATATATATAEEMALLAERMRRALHDLRHAKLGGRRGRRLYQLPWYMFIGPPGAGKTTALTHCGLRFPLADETAPAAIGGVGGTRNCDWWFTDEAVLIDTAGRYTTQDSDAAVDAGAWLGFLRLLKKHRGRQPLNGVLLSISLSDLSELSEAERRAHAKTMRKRVRELYDELGVRIPVYVLFTKADLIAGFVEFFDGLTREEREQVWGMTLALDEGALEGGAVAGFPAEFDALIARLNDRMLERISQETDVQRRRLIFGFPQQVASLRDTARDFLEEIFRPSRLESRTLMRGIYLTSGTQDGTPIDRLLGTMAGQFGLRRQAVTAFSGTGRSYFLARLIREVVFREAGLVGRDPRLERRARLIHWGAYAAAAAILLGMTGIWLTSYAGNLTMIGGIAHSAGDYTAEYKTLADRGAQDTDLPPVLPPLHTLRSLPGGYETRDAGTPIALTFGLYQGAKLSAASVDAYDRSLDGILLPRLLARLETEMRAKFGDADTLYELLKVYLILGRQGPLDSGLVEKWLQADLEASFPGEENAGGRDALLAHAAAMLERPVTAPPLDGALVAKVRGILTREPLAEYSYSRIMRSRRIRELPEWTVAENAGPGASRVFALRSGKKLSTGVPGIFSYSGYHSVLLPVLPTVTQDIAEDGWVLGQPQRDAGGKLEEATRVLQETTRLRRDVLGLYLNDYVRHWDAMVADIALKPFGDLQQALEELNLLSGPDSPFRDLLQAVDAQTQLSRSDAAGQVAGKAQSALLKAGKRAAGFAGLEARVGLSRQENEIATILSEGFGTDAATGKPVDPATRVDAHFRWIHDFVTGSDNTPAPMEVAIGKMSVMYQNFSQVSNAPNQGQALLSAVKGVGGNASGTPAEQLRQLSTDLPKPIAVMLQTVSQSGANVASSGAAAQLSETWRSKVLPLCQAAFNRYPFVAGSAQDVPMDDFTRLLGPGGLMEGFFNDNLAPLVDTTQIPWRWQSSGNTALGLSDETLLQFQRAAQIRDALFNGGTQMQVKFELEPQTLSPDLRRVTLDIAGHSLTYDHGPVESAGFQWPDQGKTMARATLTPVTQSHETVIEKTGPWALLRLMDAGKLVPSGQPDQFTLTFTAPQGAAAFQLNASSVRNPFSLDALRQFRCPAKL